MQVKYGNIIYLVSIRVIEYNCVANFVNITISWYHTNNIITNVHCYIIIYYVTNKKL